jgi:phage-related protein
MNTQDNIGSKSTNPAGDHVHHFLKNKEFRKQFQWTRGHKPNGISISSAIPSIPINVKAIAVTTGTVAHPKS